MKRKLSILLLGALTLSSCQDEQTQKDLEKVEAELTRLSEKIEKVSLELAERQTLEEKIETALAEESELALDWDAQVGTSMDLANQVDDIASKYEAFRSQYIAKTRSEAVGESHDTLESLSGSAFEKVVITRVTDVGIEFKHRNGRARLRCSDLPTEMQDRFQWDAEEARRITAQEEANFRAVATAAREADLVAANTTKRAQKKKRPKRRFSQRTPRKKGALLGGLSRSGST